MNCLHAFTWEVSSWEPKEVWFLLLSRTKKAGVCVWWGGAGGVIDQAKVYHQGQGVLARRIGSFEGLSPRLPSAICHILQRFQDCEFGDEVALILYEEDSTHFVSFYANFTYLLNAVVRVAILDSIYSQQYWGLMFLNDLVTQEWIDEGFIQGKYC